MRNLLIIGAGGYGREVHAWARQCDAFERDWRIKGFLDDNPHALAGKNCPAAIMASVRDYAPSVDDIFVCAIGIPQMKRRCCDLIGGRGGQFVNVIHRSAVLGENVSLGVGVVVCPGAVISVNTRLGDHVGVNLNATVDHDCVIGSWSQINCHCDLTGGVCIGEEVFLGSHVSILPGVRIGRGATVGAGAVVTREVNPHATVLGVPARERMGRT